jgi:nucleoside 2-deoxyribosyltransferase
MTSVYIIGSLANPLVPATANRLRQAGFDVFSSWYCASENADVRWQEHEQGRGLTYIQALKDYAAQNVFHFDKTHLDRCDTAVLVYKAGRSGHLELGYAAGRGKKTYILLDEEPAKWDVMLNFADGVCMTVEELVEALHA